jgi:hypothetical protein
MCKWWESTRPETIQLVFEEHHLFLLLLNNFQQLALLRNLLASLLRVGVIISLIFRSQVNNRLSFVNLLLENAGFIFKLFVLLLLVSYLTTKLTLSQIYGLNTLVSVQFKLLKLNETFLFFLITLGVLSLNYLLGLSCHSVELDILSPFFKVGDPQLEDLVLNLNLSLQSLMGKDVLHLYYLCMASRPDFTILLRNDFFLNQDCIFVIGSYRQLRNFELTLSHIDNHFEIELFSLNLFKQILIFLLHLFFL